jgi:hypothetical protein
MSSCSFAGKASSNRGLFPLCIHVPALIPYSMDTQIEYIIMYEHYTQWGWYFVAFWRPFIICLCWVLWWREKNEMKKDGQWDVEDSRACQDNTGTLRMLSFHHKRAGSDGSRSITPPPFPSPPLPEGCRAERPILELIFRTPNWGQIVIIWYCTDEMSIFTLILPSGSVYGAKFLITKLLQVNKFE